MRSFLAWLPWLCLLVGLGATYAFWDETRSDNRQAQQDRFDFYVAEVMGDIENRMRAYEQVLNGTVGLLSSRAKVERQEFKAYVESQQLEKNYPGIQGVGFALLLPAHEKRRHEELLRKEGFPDYRLHPAGDRDIYTAIIYIEPFDWRNQRAFGYDMYSEPVRREAMQRAWESGASSMSGKVRLLQETDTDVQAGLLMYRPVYRQNFRHDSLEERRAHLLGWAYMPFRMNDLMQGILRKHFGEQQTMLDLEIFDGSELTAAHMLYDSDGGRRVANNIPSSHMATRQMLVGGRTWTLVIHSLRPLDSPARLTNIAMSGIAGSLMLSALLWLLIHGRRRAIMLADDMSRDLVERERYQTELLAHLPAAVVVHGADTTIQFCNEEARRLLGMSEEDVLGKSARSFVWQFLEEDGSTMAPSRYPVNLVLSSQAPLRGYVLGIVLNQSDPPLWVQINAFPYFDAAAQIHQVVVTFLDITAGKTAKQALRLALDEFDDLYNHAPCGYHSLNETGCIVRINQTELTWLGYTREEVLGKRFTEFLSPGSLRVFTDNYPRFKATGQVRDLEYELIRKDGSSFTGLLSATAIYDASGGFVMTRSILHDITERKQAELALQRLNHLYALLNRANQAIVRLRDLDQLLEEICRVAVEEGGFVMAWAGRVVDGRVTPYAHWGREEGYLEQVRIIINDQALGAGPTGIAIREGHHFICDDIATDPHMKPWRQLALARGYRSSAAFPVRVDGAVVGAINLYAPAPHFFSSPVIALLDDLTEDVSFAMNAHNEAKRRKQAEEELRQLNEQLEQRVQQRTHELEVANKDLESFSYSVSHDLRAPLRSIDGFSQLLLKRYGETLDDTGRDYLGRVRRASQRMGELIDDLLNLSRMTRSPLRCQEVDLSALAGGLMQDLQRTMPERQVKLRIQPDMHCFGDPGLLRVVLDNLLGNAWKFTRHVDPAEIEFGCQKQDEELVYFVRDNGAGFDNAYAKKLFQVFQRLHSEAEFEGTGIGLATVHRIIQRHHGRVWATAVAGHGASFLFTLPGREACAATLDNSIDEQVATP